MELWKAKTYSRLSYSQNIEYSLRSCSDASFLSPFLPPVPPLLFRVFSVTPKLHHVLWFSPSSASYSCSFLGDLLKDYLSNFPSTGSRSIASLISQMSRNVTGKIILLPFPRVYTQYVFAVFLICKSYIQFCRFGKGNRGKGPISPFTIHLFICNHFLYESIFLAHLMMLMSHKG